jgi:hypothetical protein
MFNYKNFCDDFLKHANRPNIGYSEEWKLSESDQKKIKDFINENDLSYTINEEGIFRFFISVDSIMIQFYKYNEEYVVVTTDTKDKDLFKPNKFNYLRLKNMQQVLEQIAFFGKYVEKNTQWWQILDGIGRPSSVDMTFIKEDYTDDWSNDFIKNTNWKIVDDEQYKYLTFEKKMNVKAISPHNTLHEVSLFNTYRPAELDKLYLEIHPLCVKEKKESYYVKILINKDEIMKEWINYRVLYKKGLKLFLEELFNNKNQYIQINKAP